VKLARVYFSKVVQAHRTKYAASCKRPQYRLNQHGRKIYISKGSSKISKIDSKLRHVWPSVRPFAWKISAPSGRILIKFNMCVYLENMSRYFKFNLKPSRMTNALHGHICTYKISLNSSYNEKYFRQKLEIKWKHTFMFSNSPPHPTEILAAFEIVCKSLVLPDRPEMTMEYGACAFLFRKPKTFIQTQSHNL
jgi:hypothetical protein